MAAQVGCKFLPSAGRRGRDDGKLLGRCTNHVPGSSLLFDVGSDCRLNLRVQTKCALSQNAIPGVPGCEFGSRE